jgi:hypothetical protein
MTAIELIKMLVDVVEKHGVEIMVESRTCAGEIRAANKPFIYGHTATTKTIVIDSH